jgi:hypothetical protein
MEGDYGVGNIRLATEGKCPDKVSEIIKKSKIVLIACETRHWRGPNITMNQFKRTASFQLGGRSKR